MPGTIETALAAIPPIRPIPCASPRELRICVHPLEVGTVYRCSVAQRNAERAFNRALARES
jgi:hypothetical protein